MHEAYLHLFPLATCRKFSCGLNFMISSTGGERQLETNRTVTRLHFDLAYLLTEASLAFASAHYKQNCTEHGTLLEHQALDKNDNLWQHLRSRSGHFLWSGHKINHHSSTDTAGAYLGMDFANINLHQRILNSKLFKVCWEIDFQMLTWFILLPKISKYTNRDSESNRI